MAVALIYVSVILLFLSGFKTPFNSNLDSFSADNVHFSAACISFTHSVFNGRIDNYDVSTGVQMAVFHCCTTCSGLYNASPVLLWLRLPGSVPYRPRRTRSLLSSLVAFLLLTVESNPGPSAVRLGVLNARSAVQKAALIEDVINDNRLDALAVCESWIRDDAPAAIKNDIAPPNYAVLHVHRSQKSTNDHLKAGGVLAFIHRDDLVVRPIKVMLTPDIVRTTTR